MWVRFPPGTLTRVNDWKLVHNQNEIRTVISTEGSNPSLTVLLAIKESFRPDWQSFWHNAADDENRGSESNSPCIQVLRGLAYKRTVRFCLVCTWVTEWMRLPNALPHFSRCNTAEPPAFPDTTPDKNLQSSWRGRRQRDCNEQRGSFLQGRVGRAGRRDDAASRTPTEPRAKATKMRGLKMPD
jgi:hypothetical protein